EIQHAAPAIVARVNAHLGWRCVGAIALRQGPVRGAVRAPASPVPSEEETARAAAAAAEVKDDSLRASLARLGAAASAARRPPAR
ncbi:MAG: DUF721 domain-containing protein, partial [Hyphomicrobiales bacterium]|nr:DUF721 domain-containing protein [Hyphomicrobiales bacterium]